jgi:hypothetical protein
LSFISLNVMQCNSQIRLFCQTVLKLLATDESKWCSFYSWRACIFAKVSSVNLENVRVDCTAVLICLWLSSNHILLLKTQNTHKSCSKLLLPIRGC